MYYVPNVRRNLMLVSQIERKDHVFTIKGGVITIRHINTNIICVAYRNYLYIVKTEINKEMDQSQFNRRTVRTSDTVSLTSSNPHYYSVSVSENKRQSRTSTQRNTTKNEYTD